MSSCGCLGNIVSCGNSVCFVPNDVSFPRLKWNVVSQRFELSSGFDLSDDSVDGGRNLKDYDAEGLDDNVVGNSSPVVVEGGSVVQCIACFALFGVVRVGSTSILLFVSERKHVATLYLNGVHDLFLVERLSWLRLPEATPVDSLNEGGSDDISDGNGSGKPSSSQGSASNQGKEEIVSEYCKVIDAFCAGSQGHSGASYFYYSPTVNLAEEPDSIVTACGGKLSPALDDCDVRATKGSSLGNSSKAQISQRTVFQWNAPLLDSFDEIVASLSFDYHMYVPAFIRGIVSSTASPEDGVELMLINRLSYRWAGTRYNRRGLDNAGSGIAANFSASTLWVLPLSKDRETGRSGKKRQRVAAFTVLRGSVPRSWSQPANLRFVPPIAVSSLSSGTEELISHVNALLALFDGMTSLHCFDTTSVSRTEMPLSKSFETSVLKLREGGCVTLRPLDVSYTKYNVKERRARKVPYDTMRKEVDALLNGGGGDVLQSVDFWKFGVEGGVSTSNASSPTSFTTTTDSDAVISALGLVHKQEQYVRVNCLDCLDRTNLVQSMIAVNILPQMIQYTLGCEGEDGRGAINENTSNGTPRCTGEFGATIEKCKRLWVELGTSLSRLYAGSDPHFVRFVLTGRWESGYVDMMRIGLQRWWQQNFFDGQKQDAVSLLTCQHDPALFHAQFESPFSRNFSGLNKMVLGGMVAAVVATFVSMFMLFIPQYWMRGEILLFVVIWVSYIVVTVSRILKDGVSYTNYPLLK